MRDGSLHYEGPGAGRRKIVIDASEIKPGVFEVMAMDAHGMEIACQRVRSIEEAAKVYSAQLAEYTALTGKYARLRDDLKAAMAAAIAAVGDSDDGGACNFDACAISLPRWNGALIERAAKEAGTGCFSWQSYGGRRWVFSPPHVGQARRNEIAAEAMTDFMSKRGYDALCYQSMD